MASLVVPDATGEGHAILTTSWVAVTDVDVKLLAWGPKTRLIGIAEPRAVRYAGHFGLGAFSDGPDWTDDPVSLIEWSINRTFGDYINPTVNVVTAYAQAIYWRLAPGVTCQIRTFW